MATNYNGDYEVFNGTDFDKINLTTIAANVSVADSGGVLTAANVEDALQEVAKNSIVQTAGGTSTAITLTLPTLVDGYMFTFKASYSNGGSVTTINTKPLYKPGTTTAPNLVAGKAYMVWYNLSGNNFFVKASGEGTATAGDVLSTVTFTNDSDTGIQGTLVLSGTSTTSDVLNGKTFYNTNAKSIQTGTMTNRGAVVITPSNAVQTINAGYHNGSGYVNAVSFDASKVLTGTTIAGTAGTMTNNGAVTLTPSWTTAAAIAAGYHNGSGIVKRIQATSGTGQTIYTKGTTQTTQLTNKNNSTWSYMTFCTFHCEGVVRLAAEIKCFNSSFPCDYQILVDGVVKSYGTSSWDGWGTATVNLATYEGAVLSIGIKPKDYNYTAGIGLVQVQIATPTGLAT